jgi:ABC-type uncharacterized transport system permease subunit
MPYSLLHTFSLISFFLYGGALFLSWKNNKIVIRERLLQSGLLFQFLGLSLLIFQEYGGSDTTPTIVSSPALFLLFCSFVIFLFFTLMKERSRLFTVFFISIGLVLFVTGSLFLHSKTGSLTYEISALLLVHILFSLFSQVSIFFVLSISFLVVLVHGALKRKKYQELSHMPALVPLERMLITSLQGVVFFLVISLVTGAMQIKGGGDGTTKLMFSLAYFLCYLVALFFLFKKKIAIPVLSQILLFSTLILIFMQLMLRLSS